MAMRDSPISSPRDARSCQKRSGMRIITNGKVTIKKRLNRAGATPLFGGPSAQKFVESLPPVTSSPGPRIGLVRESENASCNAGCNGSRITKGGETHGTTENTIKATKNDKPSGSTGGRG